MLTVYIFWTTWYHPFCCIDEHLWFAIILKFFVDFFRSYVKFHVGIFMDYVKFFMIQSPTWTHPSSII